ncbi:MAG: VOC family protein [Oscillospiraceae bacterium]|jgi:lactoylglutathione lyase|nr:VOC family protein [Oscillospiraceae bacterium]MCI1990126.1 VOC family protein [Oscillospiraceae bacterium]MCI2034505.1 VOC family protein [Oscillospiraceae bacterium]
MHARFLHTNFNVLDLEKSIRFYREALGLREVRRVNAPDGSFVIAFLGDGETDYGLELTWMRDRKEPYNLGDNEIHIAFRVPDKKAAHDLHERMGCICYENRDMDLYFISDPDGYWIEILDR